MTTYYYELYTVKPDAPLGEAYNFSDGELTHNGEVDSLAELAWLAGDRAILLTGYTKPSGETVRTQDFPDEGGMFRKNLEREQNPPCG